MLPPTLRHRYALIIQQYLTVAFSRPLHFMSRVKPLGRPRRRWVDNIRMDLQEVGCGYMDWIGLARDRVR